MGPGGESKVKRHMKMAEHETEHLDNWGEYHSKGAGYSLQTYTPPNKKRLEQKETWSRWLNS
jgi:hypothetical protein